MPLLSRLAFLQLIAQLLVVRHDMGYDLHITRKEFWHNEEGPVISLEEWQRYVASDPDIESDPRNRGPHDYIIISHPDRWPL